eukprot:364912-Chlamydomonas_euryale.AAC.14
MANPSRGSTRPLFPVRPGQFDSSRHRGHVSFEPHVRTKERSRGCCRVDRGLGGGPAPVRPDRYER